MKIKNIFKGIAAFALAGVMTACSSNYLEQPPISEVSDEQIAESVEGARAALYGLCQSMYIGTYGRDWIRSSNGEGYLRTIYGDSGSPVYANGFLYGYQEDYTVWMLMTYRGTLGNYVWGYAYNIINQANVILRELEKCPGTESELNFIKAQTLAMRAHAYIRLMQVYAPRFEDSKNGEELCVVLRMTPGTEGIPLSSFKDCMAAIYKDLDDAIECFENSSEARVYGFEPDINVARGLYSRIAMINHDWRKAKEMAHDARESYPIMSAEDYKAGFAEHNGEWLWYNLPDVDYNGYLSWGSNFACNGNVALSYPWSSAGVISYDFYKEVYAKYPNDIRLDLFWTPDKANKYANLGIKEEDFWDKTMINNEYFYMYGLEAKMSAAISLYMRHNTPVGFSNVAAYGTPYGVDTSLSDSDATKRASRNKWFNDFASIANEKTDGRVQFGSQVKFWADPSGLWATEIPFMRAGELLLNEAEACFELGDETDAQKLLEELNKDKRIPGYTCSLTGDALRDEIRLIRHIELWGEGDAWFSEKRWNIEDTRREWKEGDPTSNNFLPSLKGSYPASYNNGWRFNLPRAEFQFNDKIY